MSDYPDFEDLVSKVSTETTDELQVLEVIATMQQRLMDRLRAIEALQDKLACLLLMESELADYFTVDHSHTPPLARADLRGFPVASEADCQQRDPPAPEEPE